MLVELTNHATQEKLQIEAEDINLDELTERFKINFSAEEFRKIIDNLNIPAEAKALLVELLGVSIKVGTVVLEVGKKILEIVRALVKKFPHITAGLILAATLSFLVSCIPFLGPLLSWICTPLLLLVGVGAGVIKEMEHTDLGKALNEVIDIIFAGLKKIPVPPLPIPV